MVLASTCAVYGDSEELPLKEVSSPQPLSPYAASKLGNEVYSKLYTRVFELPLVVLRYFNVFGPRQRPDSQYAAAIPIFISSKLDGIPPEIYVDGEQQRDFIFVEDVVKANLLAAEVPEAAGKVFNICTGRPRSLLKLLNILANILPEAPLFVFAPPRQGDIYRSYGNPSYAHDILGFKSSISLIEGLEQTVMWIRQQKEI